MEPELPAFAREIDSTLAVHSQYVLHGNIWDVFLRRTPERAQLMPLRHLLWHVLEGAGYQFLLTYDQVDGLAVYPATDDEAGQRARDAAKQVLGEDVSKAKAPSLERLRQYLTSVTNTAAGRAACLVDHASRLAVDVGRLDAAERDFFLFCAKLSRTALPGAGTEARPNPLYNPIFWLVERELDLPVWFTADNERFRAIGLPRPDLRDREDTAALLARSLPGGEDRDADKHCHEFAEQAEGLTLRDMTGVTWLARDRRLTLSGLPAAVRVYKLGVLDDPWRQSYLRRRIVEGERAVPDKVVGQPHAVTKTLDILKRAALGLSGAQARVSSNRPRGVLFFAGPTGVGKTELAKAVAALVFGNENAFLRFDMSEFSAEHSGDRLIGAPPGYVGYEVGGELTNAVRQQPFRVILFDEIEKAHPRILDKFLQILEDGRLTDGRGATTYFSGCVLIFTSNLGVTVTDPATNARVPNIDQQDPYEVIESKVKAAITDHFTTTLARPELLNRFGDNIVVFDFVSREAAERIFTGQLANILHNVHREQDITVELSPQVRDELCAWCTADLSNGGRGIGTALESLLINPLSRALFDRDLTGGALVRVTAIDRVGPDVHLTLT
ncbi:AAA family ATPase [Actinophytocola xinjiangensis]|uniref:AAA family ATPase n=1 Tax=Actinophytocola xinjiangensis TaxID=485602 RepID=A0A7Z0WKZ5_9PSEU|nr:AAA family ATPase [Actinophytocola xinjiangensis]OLF09154.1 AAA family ATPase [Actinophytocola xinjiangensis]